MPDEQNLTVFVIDDDDDIRSSLSRALGIRGYLVETFSSARQFLDEYDKNKLGCVILDYGMPDMNGLELQQHMKQQAIDLPIIFITGHGGIPESVRAIKEGAVDFLEKPFRQKTLVNCIETAFGTLLEVQQLQQSYRQLQNNFDRLTNREKEVAQFIVLNPSSTSSKDIGRHLEISPRTVDHHRARVLEKMGMTSVTELVDQCVKAGLFL
ncbi:response regulator transcription factor [Leucothrix pacifica]|uniref:DNA-binding response regulator n=1 Tax=Leucothrix pacifica TaxID=1247513 RepID=A0A317CHA5_9GAMM|nr:response regulator [Leucothrix pacifica]PWQ95632.1 DNA-binding response regulator [Leucothrix pacifica]